MKREVPSTPVASAQANEVVEIEASDDEMDDIADGNGETRSNTQPK